MNTISLIIGIAIVLTFFVRAFLRQQWIWKNEHRQSHGGEWAIPLLMCGVLMLGLAADSSNEFAPGLFALGVPLVFFGYTASKFKE